MARKSARKTRTTKPAQPPIRIVSLLDAAFAELVIEFYEGSITWAAQQSARAAGKQREKENQPVDEETSRVALGSAAPTKHPLKRVRTTPAVGTSDRVLRSRQAPAVLTQAAPAPARVEEAIDEERPRKRARTVASVTAAGPTSPCLALPPAAGLSGVSEGPNTMATHKRVLHLRGATLPSVVESTAAPPPEVELTKRVTAPLPPRARLIGPGMNPNFIF
ncbi:hypothetical protein HYPSUDRAFT_201944 [Hypholoma sublateritium FD-334 SS-4]|uniref:Uncharacterized protein n=1 Tax=Hypholoma sublateritium (strain FD-334 SS-4) TaxID=945553 RepID=A0A0D2P1N4_HYPSF|nr:hypothetical protein HYPSUDRAFT_201944 [Hypholoma sublateritium FD-334 SS-4]